MKNKVRPFMVEGLDQEAYHSLPDVNNSMLSMFSKRPSNIEWIKSAPVDQVKLRTLDFGRDFHSYFLEPDLFRERFKVLPPCNRRKPSEKMKELELIQQWRQRGIQPVKDEDFFKLDMMRGSALADPLIGKIMSMSGGIPESSIFWTDKDSGVNCKIRPDYIIEMKDDMPPFKKGQIVCMDLKTTMDINRLDKSVEDFRYYVQDAFYTEGLKNMYPDKEIVFIFAFVSTKANMGRYHVDVVQLSESAKFDGEEKYNEELMAISKFNGSYQLSEVDRPYYATIGDDLYD